MTATPVPTRLLVALGALVLLAAAFFVVRPLLLDSGDSSSSSLPATPAQPAPSASNPTPSQPTPAPATPAKPRIELLPGVPSPIAAKLQGSKTVVVSLYSSTAKVDRDAMAEAAKGAKQGGVPFVAIDVIKDTMAKQLQSYIGPVTTPAILIVQRPGKVVQRFDGVYDAPVVAQAARIVRGK